MAWVLLSVAGSTRGPCVNTKPDPGVRFEPLLGQKALVTGASSGIGRAIALSLGEAGADVVENYAYASEEDEAQALVEEIRAKGSRALALRADLSDEAQVRNMFWRMIDEFGTIDILVNNAALRQDAPFHELTLAQRNEGMAVHLTGQFLCSREAVREFMRRGVKQDVSCSAGKIICISCVDEVIPREGQVSCATPKGDVMLMMKRLAREVAPYRIRVNSICPDAIRTPANEIGRATVWIASDCADYVHGVSLFADGDKGFSRDPE